MEEYRTLPRERKVSFETISRVFFAALRETHPTESVFRASRKEPQSRKDAKSTSIKTGLAK
jgi:hypothetical protein